MEYKKFNDNDFKTHLKKLRISHNLTQKELAEKLNLTERGYQNYEIGSRFPSIEILQNLASVLNIPFKQVIPTSIEIKSDSVKKVKSIYTNETILDKFEEFAKKIGLTLDEFLSYMFEFFANKISE